MIFIPILDDLYVISLHLHGPPLMAGTLRYFEKDPGGSLYVFDLGEEEWEVLHRISFKRVRKGV